MLRALSGPLAGATFEVGARVLIGRVPSCDILIADVEVSREHAMVVSDSGVATLVDLGSSNGTLIEGKKIKRVGLSPGDTFSISSSSFIFDRAPPISTTPVLATQFSRPENPEGIDGKPTREISAVGGQGVTSTERETRRSIEAVTSEAERPEANGGRPTVRLEAAGPRSSAGPATVELKAVESGVATATEESSNTRATASLAAQPGPESEPEAPPTFDPPPPPKATPPSINPPIRRTDEVPAAEQARLDPRRDEAYDGDLMADVTAYRAFRLRLQRGEIPSGEEVAAMIDLEAVLREPPAESSRHRDVVTQRFFRRFPFEAQLCARFTASGQVIEAKGVASNLSVDGLRCSLELGDYAPAREQLAMLVIEHTRDGVDVRYSITARVVYNRSGVVGFVFAGVPSWAERGFEDAETAVRARPKL